MWQTFQVIMEYLESIHKIVYDKNIRFNFDARADGEDVFMLTNPQQ